MLVEVVAARARRAERDARVVDDDGHVAQLGGDPRDLRVVGDVQRDRHDVRIGDRRHVARAGVDLGGAGVQQRAGEGLPETAVGTGDEGDGSFDVHGDAAPEEKGCVMQPTLAGARALAHEPA